MKKQKRASSYKKGQFLGKDSYECLENISGEIILIIWKLATSFYFYTLFVYGCAASLLLLGVFSCLESGGYSLDAVHRLLIVEASLVEHRVYPDCSGFRSCGSRAPNTGSTVCGARI